MLASSGIHRADGAHLSPGEGSEGWPSAHKSHGISIPSTVHQGNSFQEQTK